jgi:hypothetical protein
VSGRVVRGDDPDGGAEPDAVGLGVVSQHATHGVERRGPVIVSHRIEDGAAQAGAGEVVDSLVRVGTESEGQQGASCGSAYPAARRVVVTISASDWANMPGAPASVSGRSP